MSDGHETLFKTFRQMDEAGEIYTFNASVGAGSIVLSLVEETATYEDIEIRLRGDGTYTVSIRQSKKQRLLQTLRERWSTFHDWDDGDLEQLLDELGVVY